MFGQNSIDTRARRAGALWTVALIASTGWLAHADEPSLQTRGDRPATLEADAAARPALRFDATRQGPDLASASGRLQASLPPRLAAHRSQLELLSAADVTPHGGVIADHMLYDQIQRSVQRGLERQTKRAVRDYLLDVTGIEGWLKGKGKPASVSTAVPTGAERRRAVRLDWSISHLVPKLKLKVEHGPNALRLGMSAKGNLSLGYRHLRLPGTEFVARVHEDQDAVSLHCRFEF